MRAEIGALQKELEVTTIYVTHDQVEAMTMGTRIALMCDGVLQQIDAPEVLYARPRNLFVAGFIGSPKMNLVPGRLTSLDGEVAIEWLGIEMPLRGKLATVARGVSGDNLIVGLRPEDLRLEREARPATAVHIRGRTEVVEPLGSETLVTTVVDDTRLIARIAPRSGVEPGDDVDLSLDPTHLHMFDPESGLSLLHDEK
jgi:multiple sugar transport system ATP-binding protein